MLLGAIGCAAISPSQPPASVESSQSAASAPTSPAATESSSIAPSLAQAPSDPSNPRVERDYAPTAPLPATGQVTVRGSIRDVESDRMITDCPSDSAPYALAESTHYLVQICSAEYDPWLPKYYMSRAKDGSGSLEITNNDPDTARQLIFPSGDYSYTLYRDSTRPDQTNAYLEIHTPDGTTHAEALLYFYQQIDRPTP